MSRLSSVFERAVADFRASCALTNGRRLASSIRAAAAREARTHWAPRDSSGCRVHGAGACRLTALVSNLAWMGFSIARRNQLYSACFPKGLHTICLSGLVCRGGSLDAATFWGPSLCEVARPTGWWLMKFITSLFIPPLLSATAASPQQAETTPAPMPGV